MEEKQIKIKSIANEILEDEFGIAILSMVIEEIAFKSGMRVLDFYDGLREAAESVIEEYGDRLDKEDK